MFSLRLPLLLVSLCLGATFAINCYMGEKGSKDLHLGTCDPGVEYCFKIGVFAGDILQKETMGCAAHSECDNLKDSVDCTGTTKSTCCCKVNFCNIESSSIHTGFSFVVSVITILFFTC